MINFEEELKRFKPIPGVNQAEEAIMHNDLKDISDIITQVTEELRGGNEPGQTSFLRR